LIRKEFENNNKKLYIKKSLEEELPDLNWAWFGPPPDRYHFLRKKLNLLFKFYFNLVIGLKNISILEKKNSFDLFMFFKINSYYKCPMSQNAGELGQMI
jgi:hypothetical protein